MVLALGLLACEEEFPTPGACVEVSLVTELCGQAVLKIENPAYYHLGETWNGHENVFFTFWTCEDMNKPKEGRFMVTLADSFNPGDCAVCMAALDYQGDKKYPVKRVDVCTQQGE